MKIVTWVIPYAKGGTDTSFSGSEFEALSLQFSRSWVMCLSLLLWFWEVVRNKGLEVEARSAGVAAALEESRKASGGIWGLEKRWLEGVKAVDGGGGGWVVDRVKAPFKMTGTIWFMLTRFSSQLGRSANKLGHLMQALLRETGKNG